MALSELRLSWIETGADIMLARYSVDIVSTDGYRVDLAAQYVSARLKPIVPRVARIEISGGYNEIAITLDASVRVYRTQGQMTLRLAGQKALIIEGRTRGAAPTNVTITFYSDDRFIPYTSGDIYYRDGSSGEPLTITYITGIYINAGVWKWNPAGNAPFNNNLDIRIPIELRPANSARYDGNTAGSQNGLMRYGAFIPSGYYDGAANNVDSIAIKWGYDQTDPVLMFPVNQAGFSESRIWQGGRFGLRGNGLTGGTGVGRRLDDAAFISGIGGRGALYVVGVPLAGRAIGTNVASRPASIVVEQY